MGFGGSTSRWGPGGNPGVPAGGQPAPRVLEREGNLWGPTRGNPFSGGEFPNWGWGKFPGEKGALLFFLSPKPKMGGPGGFPQKAKKKNPGGERMLCFGPKGGKNFFWGGRPNLGPPKKKGLKKFLGLKRDLFKNQKKKPLGGDFLGGVPSPRAKVLN